MPTYRILTNLTTDVSHPRYVVMETRDDGEERFVSEHATQEEAREHLTELRERAEYWRSKP